MSNLFSKAAAKATARAVNVSSKVASVTHSPAAEKVTMSIIARFLPDHMGNALVEMLDIIQKLFPGDLNAVDINTTLSVLAILQAKRTDRVHEIRKYTAAEDSPIAKKFAHYFKYATAAYGKTALIDIASMSCSSDKTWIEKHTGLPPNKIHPYINENTVKGRHMLEHFVAVDDVEKSVVLALKGTLTLEGALKDVRCDYKSVNVWGGNHDVHEGMWMSAQELVAFPSLVAQIKQELEAHPDYKLVVVGHSLGGAVASLVSTLLAKQSPDGRIVTNDKTIAEREIICYGFEPAPGFDEDLALKTKPFMYTIVNKNDIVPSLSHGALLDFKAIGMMLKNDTAYLATIIDGLLNRTLDADKHLEYFRTLATNKKLVPPGRVWVMSSNELGKMVIGEAMNVNQRFGEARFLQGMITHHMPIDIVKGLKALETLE